MMRTPNTNVVGRTFDLATIQTVWNKATVVRGYNPALVRKDSCGAFMQMADYGNTGSQFGWEIDHIRPVSQGGGDQLSNLQPLQWRNNRSKGDNYPRWICAVKAA